MSRRLPFLVLMLLALGPMPTRALEPAAWVGEPTLISGTSRYDAGEWIYTDFVYDDYGADTTPGGQPNVVSLASTSGDFRYPNGTTDAGNAADIVEVRARVVPGTEDLQVRVLLQSMKAASVPAVWVKTGGATSVFTNANAAVDEAANTLTFVLAGVAASGRDARLTVGAGLNDGQGGLRAGVAGSAHAMPGEFTTGAQTDARLFDLAFNTREIEPRGGAWNEDAQSDALAAGELAAYEQTISVDTLLAGTTTPVPALTGYSVRIFASRQNLGEGMASTFPQYRGTWQPYAVWLPSDYTGEASVPLFINMHSLSVHHNQYRGGASPSASYKTFYEQIGEGLGAVVVTPLARGPDGWYKDEALVDTLEVWADALANYNIDRDRTLVGGYSMGGYGTYRLTTLMPDSFASAVSIVGPPSNGIWAYPLPPTAGANSPDVTRPQLESTRHVPFWITQGVLDELVPVLGVVHQGQRFAELGHEYRLAVHPAEDHLSFVFKDNWTRERAWFAGHPERVTDPRRVTLRVRPASWAAPTKPAILPLLLALAGEVGARLDGGYWIDDVVVAPGSDVTASIDLISGGITRHQTGQSAVTAPGVDGPSPYLLTGQDQTWADVATTDTLTGSVSGAVSLVVDVGRAGLSDSPDVSGITVPAGASTTITFVRNGNVVGSATISG